MPCGNSCKGLLLTAMRPSGLQGSRGQYRGGSDDREDSDLESSSASDAEDCRVFSPSLSPAGISACWTNGVVWLICGGGWGMGWFGVLCGVGRVAPLVGRG